MAMDSPVIQPMPIRGCCDQEPTTHCCSVSEVRADLLSARDGGKEPAFDLWAFEWARFFEPSNVQAASIFFPQRSAPSVLASRLLLSIS